MSDAIPAALIAPAVDPATPAPVGAPVSLTSDVLKARLAESAASAEAKLLKSLGVTDVEAAKAVIAAAKAAEDAHLSETQKLQKLVDELRPRSERAIELEAQVAAYAQRELAALPDAVRAAVTKHAGEDPAAIMKMIAQIRDAGFLTAPAPAPAAAPPPVIANTAPANAAPPPAAPGVPNHLATWTSLKTTNPVEAARYLLRHRAAISEAQKASPAT